MKILVFDLNGEQYAMDILDVERILAYTNPTDVPDSPDFVDGVINYDDGVIPILNLNTKFKFKNKSISRKNKIIVIKRKENQYGIIVDNVYEVTEASDNSFEKLPDITVNISKNYIKGLFKIDDKITILLNIENILSKDEEEEIFVEE